MMNYWLVRAKWGVENKKAEFINNDEWINGYADKYLEIVKRVETEDILLLAEDSTITHYGKCVANHQDGRHLTVDKWILLTNSIDFSAKDLANKAIFKINEELVNSIEAEIKNTTITNNINIKKIEIENFTIFKNKYVLEFSDGFNIVIGENSVGKTHLIKMLYSIVLSTIDSEIAENLIKAFLPDKFENLYDDRFNAYITIYYSNNYFIKYNFLLTIDEGFSKLHGRYIRVEKKEQKTLNELIHKNIVFIPAKEILSFYAGFLPLYQNRETSFDSIYYNLAKVLSLANLKNIESYPVEYKILCKLEEILEGKILLERGRFYLVSHKDNRKTEISLIAEGLRKIGMIAQLLANGSLTKNSILFWDEPETNLNPRLIRKMAEVLMELSRAGMQIFIATHSFFLVKEIEILRQKTDKIKYFGLGFDENKEVRVSQSEDFEYLDDIVILDEELAQANRFLTKEDNE